MTEPNQPTADQPATDTDATSLSRTRGARMRWVYPILAVTGIAVGIFVVAAGLYLLFAPASWHPAKKDCCASMEAKMKAMKEDMQNKPCMGSTASMPSMSPAPSMPPMSPMPNTPSMSPMPGMSPTPSMPMPPR